LLGKAAVFGGSFEFNQLLYMAGSSEQLQRPWSQGEMPWTTPPDSASNEDTVLDLLEEALAAGLLTEESKGTHITYHFWHPLIVSHLYERLSAARRAQLHRRAATALLHLHSGRETEVAAAITYHLSKGGSDAGQIAHYAEIAGNRAYSLSAYSEAQYYYRQAISALTEGSSSMPSVVEQDPLHLACLLERVAECSKLEGNYEEIRHLYERALDMRNQQRVDPSEFEDDAEFQVWRQQEAQIQALIWREIGRTWATTGEYARARQCYIHGKQVMYEAGVTSGAAWACLHLQYGNICRLEGNYEEAHRCAQEALEVLEQAMQDRWMKGGKSRVAISKKSTYPALETRTARSLLGDPLEVGQAHEILGVIEVSIGQFTESLKHLKTALNIFEQHDLVMAMAQTCCNLGAVHAFKAENTIARTYYRRSLELAERMGDLPNMAFVTGNLGDVAARSGDLL
jgi:tetratricopeptide (TPR) repeat protein